MLANLPKPIVLPAGYATNGGYQVAAAIDEFSERTFYRPYFQTSSTPTSVSFDPPGPDVWTGMVGGSQTLLLRNGLISCTSIYNLVDPSQPVSSTNGNLLVQNQDYFLQPADAPTYSPYPKPYTNIKFSYVQRGLPQSIVITGVWGNCQGTISDQAWMGMLNLATQKILGEILEGWSLWYTSIKDDDTTISNSPELIRRVGQSCGKMAYAAIYRLRRQT